MNQHIFAKLVALGWLLESASKENRAHLPERYSNVPDELRCFVASFQSLSDASNTKWFLSTSDYNACDVDGFRWNEFELMSLASAEGDPEWTEKVLSFWSIHLPIFIGVRDHYQYVAYCTEGPNCGMYVLGDEPEFEEVTVIGSSLTSVVAWLVSNEAFRE